MNLNKTLCFDDVLLVPRYSEIMSRSNIDISSALDKNIDLKIPIISSPMDTVTECSMAVAIDKAGGVGIVHRYNSIQQQQEIVELVLSHNSVNVGVAVGVSGDYLDRAIACVDKGAKIICVDIAHGHHALMRYALKCLRNTFGTRVHIMAGNVATLAAFNDLSDWGADSIRVGIGGGSICSTRLVTGHGVPTLQSVIDCSKSDRDTVLIADGGIKNSGDIVKALAAGADFVMAGSLLAGTDESPGKTIREIDTEGRSNSFKQYRGMASRDAQINWRGHAATVEGVSSRVPIKGPVSNIIKSLASGVRSGLSYSGSKNIKDLQCKSEFIIQSSNGTLESGTHILAK